jgi:hypothetical protein
MGENTEDSGESQHINLDSMVTTPDGVLVPVKITVTYPADHGVWAVMALRESGTDKNTDAIYRGLIDKGDLSILKALGKGLP